ncbi:KGK domain-containing protein [Microcoleus sp. D2_18a_D3]|uniref:KGK domain-containing protein n=1 Tax=Microcoleus sp. D2_18a_D3 TaxID=3055330 RepID=UPI002FD6C3B4
MNDKIESNKNYETVGDDDVLLFDEATFMVRNFKKLTASKFSKILETYVGGSNNQGGKRQIIDCMNELVINEQIIILGSEINWISPKEGIDCQVLKIGSKGWEKGKLKIEVNEDLQLGETQVCIKFCPDEPPELKSPLDDIRQSEEYKKLSNNN